MYMYMEFVHVFKTFTHLHYFLQQTLKHDTYSNIKDDRRNIGSKI